MSSPIPRSMFHVSEAPLAKQFRRLQRLFFRSVSRLSGPETRPEAEDYSMAVPFAFDTTSALARPRRLAAICHIFYVDLAEELLSYLSNLPHGTDVFISTTDQGKASAIQQTFSRWKQGRVEIQVVANRGRDIAPKLIAFCDVYSAGYQLILFLHSKKTEREDGLAWRKALLATLAGSRETVASILENFRSGRGSGDDHPAASSTRAPA